MAVLVAFDQIESREILMVHVEHEAFGDHGHAVVPPIAQSFDDGAGQNVDDPLEADVVVAEFLGNQRQRRARRLADAEREVPGFAPHGDDEIPTRRGLGIDH